VRIFAGNLGDFLHQPIAHGDGLQAETRETVVFDVQVVLVRLIARVGQVVDLAPVRSAIIWARSRTRWVSVIWLNICTRSPDLGGFSNAIWMQRTVS
jgi:hypothetical protein